MNRRTLFRSALGGVAALLPIKAAANEPSDPQVEYLKTPYNVVSRPIDWYSGSTWEPEPIAALPQIGDRVQTNGGAGWGREYAIGTVTKREVIPAAEYLGELAEVTFDDGFAFWCGDANLTIVERAA